MSGPKLIESLRIRRIFSREPDGVYVYYADLDQLAFHWEGKEGLSANDEERARATSFADASLSTLFLLGRHFLRMIIAHHCETPIDTTPFLTGKFGKPYVAGLPFHFNLSHSQAHAVVGISHCGEIGVDIDTELGLDACQEIYWRVLTENEWAYCLAAGNNKMLDRFRQFWTLKEAILKASGEGLKRDMREVELKAGEESHRILKLPESYGSLTDWRVGVVKTGLSDAACAYAIRTSGGYLQ